MRAIIVDDEVAARKALRERCATERDIEVVGEYADAESALAALTQQAPDLIFLDVKMGRVSGMQLAQALEPGLQALLDEIVVARLAILGDEARGVFLVGLAHRRDCTRDPGLI